MRRLNHTMDNRYEKKSHRKLNNIQQQFHNIIKLNRATPITAVPYSQHIANGVITCNTKLQLAKFYHKSAFSPSISTFIKSIDSGFSTWHNLTDNLIQIFLTKITSTSKGHMDQVYQNIQTTNNFKDPTFPIIKKHP